MSQASVRAQQIMLGILPEQRKQARVQLPIPARVSYSASEAACSMAYLRDINTSGAFFYCDLEVKVGQTLWLELVFPDAMGSAKLNCEGTVLRVVEPARKGLTGIAVQFQSRAPDEPFSQDNELERPFIGWTVEMVERVLASRPELTAYASGTLFRTVQ